MNKTKTGFSSTDKLIEIYMYGNPFYFFQNTTGTIFFNLPVGSFETENNLLQLDKPVYYALPRMPFPDRFFKMGDIEIIQSKNRNKCSVVPELNVIVIDPKVNASPFTWKAFIILHELGHYLYSGEKDADLFATYWMLQSGFNPSQIQEGILNSLSHYNSERKILTLENTKNANDFRN